MTLPYDPVFDAIQQLLGYTNLDTGAWVEGNWDVSVAKLFYENEIDRTPRGELAPWVQIILDTHVYGQESIGADDGAENQNRWDEDGILWFHVFVPKGKGTREARRIAKGLVNIFRGLRLLDDDLEFGDADMGTGDPGRENANYYLLSVSLSWRLTEAT